MNLPLDLNMSTVCNVFYSWEYFNLYKLVNGFIGDTTLLVYVQRRATIRN